MPGEGAPPRKKDKESKDGEGKGNGDENAEERFGIEMYWGTGLLVSSSLESSSVWFITSIRFYQLAWGTRLEWERAAAFHCLQHL